MSYTIRQVCERTGLTAHTLRYYEKEGLLPAVARSGGGIRLYSDEDLELLGLICCLKNTGMPLSGIADFVRLTQEGEHTLLIAVTNPDSGEGGTYTLSIRYEPEDSGDARLAYVRMYGYTLEPMFDPDVHEYSTAIDSRWASVAFMPADSSATVRMSLNGGSPITGYPGTSHQLNWAEGDNTLVLTCTRGTQTTSYTLRVAYAS